MTRRARLMAGPGDLAGSGFDIEGEATIGRSPDNRVVLPAAQVSARHARIGWDEGGGCWVLEDLGSRNGVYLAGMRVEEPERLGSLEVINVAGAYDFVFHALPEGAAADRPLPPAELGGEERGAAAGAPAAGGTFLEEDAPLPPAELGGAEEGVGSGAGGTFLDREGVVLPAGLGGEAPAAGEGERAGGQGRTFLEEDAPLPPAELGGTVEAGVGSGSTGGDTFLEQEALVPPAELGGVEAGGVEAAPADAEPGEVPERDGPGTSDTVDGTAAGSEPVVATTRPAADARPGSSAPSHIAEPAAPGPPAAEDLGSSGEAETDRLARPAAFAPPGSSSPETPAPAPEPTPSDALPGTGARKPGSPAKDRADELFAALAAEHAPPSRPAAAGDESATDKLDRPAEMADPPPGTAAVPRAAEAPARGPFALEVVGLDGGVEVVALPPGEHLVGRGKSASLPLDNPTLSRRHARVVVLKGRVRVSDLGSTNHTWVAGEQLEPGTEVEAAPGAELRFGALVARLIRQPHEEPR